MKDKRSSHWGTPMTSWKPPCVRQDDVHKLQTTKTISDVRLLLGPVSSMGSESKLWDPTGTQQNNWLMDVDSPKDGQWQ